MKVAEYLAATRPALSLRYSEIPGAQATMSQVLQRIREEVAGAVGHVLPAGTKISIRYDSRSVRVEIVAWRAAVFSSDYLEHVMEAHVLAAAAELRRGPYVVGATTALAEYTQRRELHDGLAQALRDVEAIADRHNYRHREITVWRQLPACAVVSRRRVMDARIELRRRMPVVVLFYSVAAGRYALAEGHRLIAQVYDTVTDLNSESPAEGRIEISQISIEEKINVEDLGDGCTRVTVYGGTTEEAALVVAGFFGEEVTEIAMGAW